MAQDAFSMMTQTPAMALSQGPAWEPSDAGDFVDDESRGDCDHRHIQDIEALPHGALPGNNKGLLVIANPDVFPRSADRSWRPPQVRSPRTHRIPAGSTRDH